MQTIAMQIIQQCAYKNKFFRPTPATPNTQM